MKVYLFSTLFLLLSLSGCTTLKEYQIGDRMVTKRKYDRKSDRITKRFVRRMTDDVKRMFLELEVVYDTTNVPR